MHAVSNSWRVKLRRGPAFIMGRALAIWPLVLGRPRRVMTGRLPVDLDAVAAPRLRAGFAG
jgi:hypothetical protein